MLQRARFLRSLITHPQLRVVGGLATFFAILLVGGCDTRVSQGTPDETVATAFKLVRDGRAEKLPRLIYADTKELRSVLGRTEKLAGAMEDLAKAVAKAFPEDVKKYTSQAKTAAVDLAIGQGGQATAAPAAVVPGTTAAKKPPTGGMQGLAGLLQRPARGAARGAGTGASPVKPPDPGAQRTAFESTFTGIFADPFSWISSAEGRVTTAMIADDQAAVLFDGQPAFGVGLTMREADGKWFFELPLGLPVIAGYVPQTFNEWSIVGSLIRVLENTLRELTADVNSGTIKRADQLAEKAGERAFVPAVMVFVAYSKEMDVRSRREKLVTELKRRLNDWGRQRREQGEDRDLVRSFVDASIRLAVEDLDVTVRKRVADPQVKLPDFAAMAMADLSAYVQGIMKPAGAAIDLSAAVSSAELADAAKKAAAFRPIRTGKK